MFDYERFGNPRLVNLMNDFYANEFSLFTNFFQPASKTRNGSKWVRKHGKPATPAQRLLDHPDVPETTKEKLRQQLASLNPFVLQRQIRRKLKAIFNLLR